jgi:hypothetical protein
MNSTNIVGIIIQSGILAAALGFVVSVFRYGKALADAKTQEVTAKIKDQNLKQAATTAEDCITTAVLEIAQTTVDDLKEAAADGKLTDEEKEQVKAAAFSRAKELISTDVFSALDSITGNVDEWIKSKIEAAVKKLAVDSPVAVTVVQSAAPASSNQSAAAPAAQTPADPVPDSTAGAPAQEAEASTPDTAGVK